MIARILTKLFKRPLVVYCIALITGILTACLSGSALFAGSFLVLISAVLFILSGKFKGRLYISIGVLVFYSVGAFEFLLLDALNKGRFREFDEKTVEVCGTVVSEPDIKDSRISYIIKVKELSSEDGQTASGGKLLLSMAWEEGSSLYEYGSELEFSGRLSLPKGVRNPGGFDYRKYLAQKGVAASVFAAGGSIRQGMKNEGLFLIKAGRSIKYRIIDVIDKSLPKQQAGLLNAMLIGYRDGLSGEVTDAFCDAGLTHIMAVSGANILFLIIPLAFLFKRMRLGARASGMLIIAFLLLFIYIAGFEPSVLRAVIMASVILIAGMLHRETDIYTTIAFAAILLLTASPYMLFNVGFQLSFAATLSIVLFCRNLKKMLTCRLIPPAAAGVLAATLSAQLGVLPITLAYFNRVSLISVLSNLLVVPLLEFITILGMFMAVLGQVWLGFAQLLGYFNCVLLSAVLYVTKISSGIPFASIRTVTPSPAAIVLYYALLWFMLWYSPLKNIRLKLGHASAAFALTALFITASFLLPGRLEVVFLDVGEGDAAFIRTCAGKNIMLDGGGSAGPNASSKIGEAVIASFLLDKGVYALDAVIASHGHSDHIQGLETVLEQFRVKRLIIPEAGEEGFEKLLKLADERGITVSKCKNGDVIRLDDKTGFEVLGPFPEPPAYKASSDNASLNNTSLVLKLHYGEADILFTGDAQAETERELMESGADLEAEVVKIAHHGSSTSTGSEFLDRIGPKAAVVSVGRNNFGHPSPVTMGLLKKKGVRVFRTDECGAVVLTSRGGDIRISGTVRESG